MAVDVQQVFNGTRRVVYRLTNDGDTESSVAKIDISTLTGPKGLPVDYTSIQSIQYSVSDGDIVRLHWDHTTDDEILVLSSQGEFCFSHVGGLVDPKSTGGTGDILVSTNDGASGASYTIVIELKLYNT